MSRVSYTDFPKYFVFRIKVSFRSEAFLLVALYLIYPANCDNEKEGRNRQATLVSGIGNSDVLSGHVYLSVINPARCAGLPSGVASRLRLARYEGA